MLPMTTPETMAQAVEIVFTMGAAVVAVLFGLLTGRM